jgi:phosphoribosyl-AMP cyclohydrolase
MKSMNSKKTIIIVFMLLFLFTATAQDANANFFSNVRNYFAQRGKEVPEFQCIVNINTEAGGDCLAYFLEYKLGHTCQIYTKYDEKKGIKQCDFCVDRFLSKTNKKIPKTCLDVKIEGTHFTQQEMEQIALNRKDEFEEINKDNNTNFNPEELAYAEEGVELGRITFIQGRAFIERSLRIMPAIVGEGLLCGDRLSVEEDAELTIMLDSKEIKIEEKTTFSLPACKGKDALSKKGSFAHFIGNLWWKIKEKLSGDSFEVKTPTATAGVRG